MLRKIKNNLCSSVRTPLPCRYLDVHDDHETNSRFVVPCEGVFTLFRASNKVKKYFSSYTFTDLRSHITCGFSSIPETTGTSGL